MAGVLVASLSACTSPNGRADSADLPPVSALRDAIGAVLGAPNFTVVTTTSDRLATRQVATIVVEKPDMISVRNGAGRATTSGVIAIGAVGYLKSPGGPWIKVPHRDESSNFTDAYLLWLHLLDRTTSAVRHGSVYVVPPTEAATLLRSTRLPQYQNPVGVSLSATVHDGLLRTMTLRFGGASATAVTTTVSRVGTSPPVTAPPTSQVAA